MISILDQYRDSIFETFFGNVDHCIVIVDREGRISYLNEGYCRFLGVEKEACVGKHVTDVIENSRMHIVAETGEQEMADLQHINGDYMIANRIPLQSDDEVVGALGMVLFRDTDEWKIMNSRIKDLLLELEAYRTQMQKQNGTKYSLHDIISSSPEISHVKEKVKKTAHSDVSVLLRGESGTGKELFAHSIHHLSERSTKPFVKVNCAAIPNDLIEAELFGYEEGAFTGAKKGGKRGKFQMAHGGTLFLDEIGDMPMHAQVKILRVLQEGEVEAVGSESTELIDVRIIAATNQQLEKLIEENRFREDLYYRINVVPIQIPPLRERGDDIRVLAKYFVQKAADRIGKRITGIDEAVYDVLQRYSWPGNIRELENTLESAVHLTDESFIGMDDLPGHIQPESSIFQEQENLKQILEKTEKQTIERTLNRTDGDKSKAAEWLGIGKSSLYEKIKKYDL
ncbi:sigma 54-interacting transcriptional regulator [Halobacillus locisalis]|uniref:Sigma 54-interacting transcriptional regulator n=1 Tax=Halobacillus locisalis TaxID=220753 RepID=A0A838CSJ8_9BACI|nr:sigma 54-interacting transcriptional regulator [Halobacillus locisalis]MBA2174799.1 sigma 54-interacting transcriptional regulator [Halobacillus locisalis]